MAHVQIFRSTNSHVVLVPFAKHPTIKGHNVASGKLIVLTTDEFIQTGAMIVQDLLLAFDTRDGNIRSELYEEYDSKKRKRFLEQHQLLTVFHNVNSNCAQIDVGRTSAERIAVTWPLDPVEFPIKIIKAFDEMAACEQETRDQ